MGIFGETVQKNTDINDEVLASSMIATATAGANAYLNAATTCATPELRAMYSSSLSQILTGQAALTDLSIKKEWGKPYDPPTQQLVDVYAKAESTVRNDE
ncbi:MAG: spore coat protein [bacterium]